MTIVRLSARIILSACAIAGFATLGACAGADPTSPTARHPAPVISHDDATCSSGWVVIDGRFVCPGT